MTLFNYFILTAVVFMSAMTSISEGDESSTICEEQGRKFQECSNSMEAAYLQNSLDLDVICRSMASYLSCVRMTNRSCPSLPIFRNEVYLEAVTNARDRHEHLCSEHGIGSGCTQTYITRLLSECAAIVGHIQEDTAREDKCRYNQDYLACIQRATFVCANDVELFRFSVPLAELSAMTEIKANCHDVMGDQAPGVTEEAEVHSLCTDKNIDTWADTCAEHLRQPPAVMETDGCSHQAAFIACMNLLLDNCANAAAEFFQMRLSASRTYADLCAEPDCPQPVKDEEHDVVTFCLDTLFDQDPTSPSYCSDLKEVPQCLASTRQVCPFDLSPVDSVLEDIQSLIESNCAPTEG